MTLDQNCEIAFSITMGEKAQKCRGSHDNNYSPGARDKNYKNSFHKVKALYAHLIDNILNSIETRVKSGF